MDATDASRSQVELASTGPPHAVTGRAGDQPRMEQTTPGPTVEVAAISDFPFDGSFASRNGVGAGACVRACDVFCIHAYGAVFMRMHLVRRVPPQQDGQRLRLDQQEIDVGDITDAAASSSHGGLGLAPPRVVIGRGGASQGAPPSPMSITATPTASEPFLRSQIVTDYRTWFALAAPPAFPRRGTHFS
jgi:hypothetical protein